MKQHQKVELATTREMVRALQQSQKDLTKRLAALEKRVDQLEHNTSPHVLAGYER